MQQTPEVFSLGCYRDAEEGGYDRQCADVHCSICGLITRAMNKQVREFSSAC